MSLGCAPLFPHEPRNDLPPLPPAYDTESKRSPISRDIFKVLLRVSRPPLLTRLHVTASVGRAGWTDGPRLGQLGPEPASPPFYPSGAARAGSIVRLGDGVSRPTAARSLGELST